MATIIRGGRVGRVVRGQIAATDDPVAGIAEGNRNCARAGRTHERCVVRLPAVASISGGEDPCNGRRAGLATLSKAATRTISKRFPRASAIRWSRPGRFDFAPEIVSIYSCAISYPRCLAIARRSCSCVSGCWSPVETLAYRRRFGIYVSDSTRVDSHRPEFAFPASLPLSLTRHRYASSRHPQP